MHDPWFWSPRAASVRTRVKLFCFPYAGGSATAFRGWVEHLPPHVELRAIQLPGRGARRAEPQLTDPEVLLDRLGAAIVPHLHGDFAFFGHSMGALVAFELCRWLRRAGRQLPCHLVVSGRPAPDAAPDPAYPPVRSQADTIARVRHYGGTPEAMLADPDLRAFVVPPIHADFTLLDRWPFRPEAPVAVPATAMYGTRDPSAPGEALARWRDHVSSGFELHAVPGAHFFIHSAEQTVVRLVARAIGADIAAP